MYPTVLMLAALGFKKAEKEITILPVLAMALGIMSLVHAAFLYPSYISYFNVFSKTVGEPYYIAVDSNLDWGQDVPRLEQEIKNSALPFYADLSTYVHPSLLFGSKIKYWDLYNGLPPRPAMLAVSSFKYSLYLTRARDNKVLGDALKVLRTFRPKVRGHQSILVFELPSLSETSPQ